MGGPKVCTVESLSNLNGVHNQLTRIVPPIPGFKGQSRIILPRMTACYECSLDMQTKPTTYPMCTIANTPRLPEHCIEWASVLEWPKEFPGASSDYLRLSDRLGTVSHTYHTEILFEETKLDGDDPEHIRWLLDKATARATEFNISGVTYSLTPVSYTHL